MPRFNKKVDANQKGIVSELRQLGIQVILTNMGENYPDLMVGHGGNWILLEVKNPLGGKFVLDRGQLRFLADARGFVAVVCDPDNAIQAVTDPREYCLSNSQQNKIVAWLVRNPTQETLSVLKFFDLIAEI
jgi:hypothetical protein